MTFCLRLPSWVVLAEDSFDQLVASAVGSDIAWQRLWQAVEPTLWALVDRPRFASHLGHTEGGRRRMIGAIHAQLQRRQLQAYLESRRINPRLSFARWLRVLAKRTAMRYARFADCVRI